MKQQHGLVCLLLLCIYGHQAQDTTTAVPPTPAWNGDPKLCTVDGTFTPAPNPPPMPKFPNRAEFTLERVEIKHVLNVSLPSELTLYQYIYDYDANVLVMVKNKNGFIDAEYFYYKILKKSTYYRREFCVVSDIPVNLDMDGASAIMIPNQPGGHVRPLNEFLLFSNEDQSRPPIVTPVYIGSDMIRGIPVDKWQSCYINKTDYRTVRRIWAFAKKGFVMPTGPVGDLAVPVEALISASYSFPNGTEVAEVDEVFNVHAYRNGIIETADALAPPKGVFCKGGPDQPLVSLNETGIAWPNHFSVRVEASSSVTGRWERFHLRYNQGRDGESRRIRYDYLPPGSEDYESVIHDYADDLTFVIDRRVGTCEIRAGVDLPDVNPLRDPITFFIKHEAKFIFNPPEKAWEFNGLRSCRGDNIKCTIATTSIDKFPPIVESDTGAATGETWEATNVEYGWSTRAPLATPEPGRARFDYPVSLFLRSYRYEDPSNPSPFSIRTEDVEYEFYEMSYERNPYDFDISLCYRSLEYEYLHLVLTFQLSQGNAIDGNRIDRNELRGHLYRGLTFHGRVRFSRISELEIDHEQVSNDITVFFTLLGQTPQPGSATGFDTTEPTAAAASDNIKNATNNGRFEFSMKLDDNTDVQFKAVGGSLTSSKRYISTHSAGRRVIKESYSGSSIATAVLVGLLVGLVVGVLIAAVIRIVRKDPMPSSPLKSISNPLPAINFRSKQSTAATPTAVTSDA